MGLATDDSSRDEQPFCALSRSWGAVRQFSRRIDPRTERASPEGDFHEASFNVRGRSGRRDV
jgi:hypothetical protein